MTNGSHNGSDQYLTSVAGDGAINALVEHANDEGRLRAPYLATESSVERGVSHYSFHIRDGERPALGRSRISERRLDDLNVGGNRSDETSSTRSAGDKPSWRLSAIALAACARAAICILPAAVFAVIDNAVAAEDIAPAYSLNQLIEFAMSDHPGVIAARSDLESANADVSASRWQYFPAPSVSLSGDTGSQDLIVAVEQPIWTGGKLGSQLKLAKAQAGAAELAIGETQIELALQVNEAFQLWKQAIGRAQAMRAGIERLEAYNEMIRRRVAAGVSAQGDQQLISSRLMQARSDLQTTEAQQANGLAYLSQLTGRQLTMANVSPQAVAPGLDDCATLIASSMESHPKILRLEKEVDAASSEVKLQRSSMLPNLVARGEYLRGDTILDSGVRDDVRVYLALQVTPGAGLHSFSRMKASKARVGGAQERVQAARRELSARLSAECSNHDAAVLRASALRSTVSDTQAVLESYTRLFLAGKRSWLDVINAARELTSVETSVADADAQMIATGYRLLLLSGAINN